jgi:hypothetical protein
MTLTLQFLLVTLLTTGVGAAMIWLGIGKGMLRARTESHRCASCGRWIEGWHCPSCMR